MGSIFNSFIELDDAQKTWTAILDRLPAIRDLVSNCDTLAADVVAIAEPMEAFVASNCVTVIHGDCKGWNLFFNEERALFIDMQWAGKGHPMQVRIIKLFYHIGK